MTWVTRQGPTIMSDPYVSKTGHWVGGATCIVWTCQRELSDMLAMWFPSAFPQSSLTASRRRDSQAGERSTRESKPRP